jgi:ABC-type transport system involved in multi-copper enzyme maturation permease subunit
MILTQTWTMLVDAYRELNTKKLFWISMMLSCLVVAAFAMIGNNERGLTILVWTVPIEALSTDFLKPEALYKLTFVNLGIGLWLTWIATILALVSTSSMFPDFLAGGAIETTLCKPISRARLFLTKYVMGLLFVALQVGVFALASFLVIGIRGGAWEPGIFLAVPVVVLFFSYLFCVCALLGVLTRSTIASLLLTLLFWFFLFCLNSADGFIQTFRVGNEVRQETVAARIERMEKATRVQLDRQWRAENAAGAASDGDADADGADGGADGGAAAGAEGAKDEGAAGTGDGEGTPPVWSREDLDRANPRIEEQREVLKEAQENAPTWRLASNISWGLKAALPKTQETTALLERWLVATADLPLGREEEVSDVGPFAGVDQREIQKRMIERQRGQSVAWIIGTSLAFEAVVLGIAMWRFRRRDF